MERKVGLSLFLLVAFLIAGCGGGTLTNLTQSPAISSVTVSCSPTSVQIGQTSQCSATVAGTGSFSSTVSWTAASGMITNAGAYTAPATVPASGTDTISATSTQNETKYAKMTINIATTGVQPTVTKVSVSAKPTSIATNQTVTCLAAVTGTGAYSSVVTWTATGGTITSGGVFTPSGPGTGSCVAHSAQTGYTSVSGSASIAVTGGTFAVTSISVVATPSSITTAQTSTCSATVSGTGTYSSAMTWTATGGTITSGGVFTPTSAGAGSCVAHSAAAGYTNVSGAAAITVASATGGTPAISGVTLVCAPTSITTTQTSTCTPTVTGSGTYTNTVNLSVSPSADGTLSASTAVPSGTPVTFTPASTGAATATITATSTQDTTKSAAATVAVTLSTGSPTCAGMSLGNNASLNGFVPFPTTAAWNTDISNAPLDPNNTTITSASGFAGLHLHPDFSSIAGGNYGIPYVVVDSSTQPMVPINVGAYASEGDVAEAPFPLTAPIEGAPGLCVGGPADYVADQHVAVLDRNRCMLYETYNTALCNGTWSADSETIWDMQNYEQRPWGWTSADAAGLPVFPGLVRYDEVASGAINHALRFTMEQTKNDANDGYFVEPASHASGNIYGSYNVIGMRVRLKASVDISSYSATNQVILTAMKKYGMILADNGGYFFFQGVPDARWNDSDLDNLANIPSSDFEVIQMTPTYPGWDAATAPTGAPPTISSFTSSASTVAAGSPVTLTWSATNDSYDFIDKLGGVRGGTVTFTPTATATYTLNATNQYGRSTAQVTVVVQ